MKQLSENKMALFNILSTVIVAGINFITIPIFTRVLDTSGYGIISIYTAWVQICTIFIGLKADGSIGSAKANLKQDEQDSYHFSILVLSLVPFAVIMLLTVIFLDPLSQLLSMDSILVLLMVLQSFGAFVVSLFNMRFIFEKEAQKNFLVSVSLCLLTTFLSLFLIQFVFTGTDGYLGRAYGLMVPNLLLGIGLFVSLAFSKKVHLDTKYWKFCLLLSVPLIFHGLSQLVLSQTGKIAIQQYYDNSLAGIYSIAVTIVSLLNSIYTALNNAFVPFMYDDLAGKTSEEIKQRHFRNYFLLFTLGTCAFAMMAPEVLRIMSTEAYWSATEILPYLTIGQYCVFIYSFPVNYEFYKMKTRSVAVGTILAAALNIVLAIALVPSYGMYGAAIATMISYLALFVFHFTIARYMLGDHNYSARYYVAGLAAVVAFSFLYYPLEGLVIVRWALGIVILAALGVRTLKTRTIF
jgi:O-antigen/teichoic acid export membrane protein